MGGGGDTKEQRKRGEVGGGGRERERARAHERERVRLFKGDDGEGGDPVVGLEPEHVALVAFVTQPAVSKVIALV
jgi:hypothetical protein